MYKFYPPTEYSLRNISENTIYMNPPHLFNDPYELDCIVESGFPPLDSKTPRLNRILEAWLGESIDMSIVNNYYTDYTSSLIEPKLNDTSFRNKVRISCFTRSPFNALMWAYYADSMSGICVEYDEEKICRLSEEDAYLFDVVYSEKFPVIDTALLAVWDSIADYHLDVFESTREYEKHKEMYDEGYDVSIKSIKEIYQKSLATKARFWEHEAETRIVKIVDDNVNDDSGFILPLIEDTIKSVILGPNIKPEYKNHLLSILQSKI
ncbi:DUF2971 domain-containing protein [Serratia sp. 3ACOL1]|nr:DUF2971 domain-containing protein [Serratia sp. 3ACOL1]